MDKASGTFALLLFTSTACYFFATSRLLCADTVPLIVDPMSVLTIAITCN